MDLVLLLIFMTHMGAFVLIPHCIIAHHRHTIVMADTVYCVIGAVQMRLTIHTRFIPMMLANRKRSDIVSVENNSSLESFFCHRSQ